MLTDRMVTAGHVLFRWRSYLLFAFLPLFIWAVSEGEALEVRWGDAVGEITEVLALLLLVLGEAIRVLTVGFVPHGTSGRNTDKGQIAERLNTTGLYSTTRNPLYLGNCLMYVALALYTQHLWVVAVLGLTLTLYYERIIAAEESFLLEKFGEPYREWSAQTPVFWPRLRNWRRPDMPFSLRTVIRREHVSALGGFVVLYLLELGLHTLPGATDTIAPGWHWLMGLAIVLEIVARVAKPAGWLKVEGR
ncbi:MAG: DUF1295 domain-containing protein [Rhodobacter sp.]|nr:DUF1295 domain-containing protein [Paracoccaceae bacterium]MCC0076516.1 DUF1295 domain-containing protein [Rhodobacter sp.]